MKQKTKTRTTPSEFKGRFTGIEMIEMERKRQMEMKGYDEKHDDQHACGELAMAAMCYAMLPLWRPNKMAPLGWPWSSADPMDGFKPTPLFRKNELAKAGALIAAEIDRLNRIDERMEEDTFGLKSDGGI